MKKKLFVGLACLLPVVSTGAGEDGTLPYFDNHSWWSPDGTRLVVYSDIGKLDSAQVVTMNEDGSEPFFVTNNAGGNYSPEWSPDGSRIAFYANMGFPMGEWENGGEFDIYVINIDGTGLRKLTNLPFREGSPVWSPDGQKIAFYSFQDGDSDMYAINPDGTGLTLLTNTDSVDYPMDWSADGERITFYSDRTGNWDVFTMAADGTNIIQLTDDEPDESMPAYSPDDSRILYIKDDGETSQVAVMDVDGANKTILVSETKYQLSQPAWHPDGTKITYSIGPRNSADWRLIVIADADGSNPRIVRGKLPDE